MTRKSSRPKITELDRAIDKALQLAALDAVEVHRAASLPLVGWKDGRVVLVNPEDIPMARMTKRSKGRKS